jgi:predicted Rossmann-fold nucleotide-binding protein
MYGKGAGHRRNKQMANYADALAIFPGGRGSANMFEEATKKDLMIFDFRNNE